MGTEGHCFGLEAGRLETKLSPSSARSYLLNKASRSSSIRSGECGWDKIRTLNSSNLRFMTQSESLQ